MKSLITDKPHQLSSLVFARKKYFLLLTMVKRKKGIALIILIIGNFATYAQQSASFRENFDNDSLIHFRYGSTGNKSDFKWKSGVVSATDKQLKVLSLK